MVPGVTIRTTLRSTGPCWSPDRQFVRRWQRTRPDSQFGEIVFHRMVGDPRHRDRLPAEAPRLVSEISSSCDARLARHKTVRKSHPSGRTAGSLDVGFQLEILLHHRRMGVKIFYALMGLCPVP